MKKIIEKNSKGITLVALIITIIILLILVGITISQLTENGLLKKSKLAVEETKKAQVQETIQLVVDNIIIDYIRYEKYLTNTILKEEIEKNNSIEGIIINDDLTGSYNGYEYYIDENYKVHIKDINDNTILSKIQVKEEKRIINVVVTDFKEGIQRIQIVNPSGEIIGIQELDGIAITGKLENCIANQSGDYKVNVILNNGNIEEEIINVKKIKISNKAELENFRDMVNNGITFEGDIVELVSDIDIEGNESNRNWTSIGGSGTEKYFSGTFEGNNHKILNMYNTVIIDKSKGGFFGYIKNGVIRNLGIESGNIIMKNSAGIVGFIENGNIINCYNNAKIEINNSTDWSGRIAGIAGNAVNTIIQNCYNSGEITGNDAIYECIGGIAGQISENSQILSCYNKGNINAKNTIGGIVGWTAGGTLVNNCYNRADINGDTSVGGLVGWSEQNDKIKNSYNIGNVIGNKEIGGAIGTNRGVINKLFFINTSGPVYACGSNNTDNELEEPRGSTIETLKGLTNKLNETQTNTPWKDDTENINEGYPILSWQKH